MTILSEQEVESKLGALSGWEKAAGEIQKVFTHKDFVQAISFVNKVAELAEAYRHHPDILINWNKVTLTLSTHSEGGLTEKDFKLAGEINKV
jgi:4a-hydroxytetrahydrobiopterin dehydratase